MKTILRLLSLICLLATPLNLAADRFKPEHVILKTAGSPHPGRMRVVKAKNIFSEKVNLRFKNEYDGNSVPMTLSKGEERKFDLTCNVVLAKAEKEKNFTEIKRFSSLPSNSARNGYPIASQPDTIIPTVKEGKKEATENNEGAKKKEDVKEDTKKDVVEEAPKEEVKKENEVKKEDKKDEAKKEEKGVKKEDKTGKKNSPKDKGMKEKNNKTDKSKNSPVINPTPVNPSPIITISKEKVIQKFTSVIDTIAIFSKEKIQEDSVVIMELLENLRGWGDKEEYIKSKNLRSFIQTYQDSIDYRRKHESRFVQDFLKQYENQKILEREVCYDSLKVIVEERLSLREANMQPLINEINWKPEKSNIEKLIGVCIASAIILLGLFFWYRKASKDKPSKKEKNSASFSSPIEPASLIVVGHKSLPSLKKLSLDDVYGNEAYMKIDCKDFCGESAVRAMYIKNTCIKDIYDMYAEDLRNPNNPKEDGCMVLGRWVQDAATKEYDVSLEYIVTPGDDAIFAEYELNFGGKIQLKKGDMLKRLRRDTGLQYDLTCWVHSHPGLGVFFSNSDNNVQMQLKNDQHPHFLTALVIDILTPEQEAGIFTFKPDGIMNSKNELTKMYSLEEMYKWALESERRSFNKDDYFNALSNASKRIFECYGIELSNGAIIDMTYMASNPNGFVGLVRGYPIIQGEKLECITTSVTKPDTGSDSEVIGCFVVAAHCSIPSIRKAIAQYLGKINFVLVYTATDGLITSIPVVNRDLCNNEEYYGEHLLEDLKIWTRRRR